MPVISKPIPLNLLAVAGKFKPNPNVDCLVKLLNSVPGTDKVLMFIQYFSKIVIWFFSRIGKKSLAQRIVNLSDPVSDLRILLRFYGLLPLIQWMIHIEHNLPLTPLILHIERIQNLTMIFYYPLEHIWWLAYHKVISISDARMNKIGIWSCRFWAAYIILQFGHLAIEWSVCKKRRYDVIKRMDDDEEIEKEKRAIKKAREKVIRDTFINIGHLPLAMNWSTENPPIGSVGIGIFGTFAAIYQLVGAWKTANEQ